jgi:hypothetical protein
VGAAACLVGQGRLELPTSRLSGVRSNHLSYWPDMRKVSRPFKTESYPFAETRRHIAVLSDAELTEFGTTGAISERR